MFLKKPVVLCMLALVSLLAGIFISQTYSSSKSNMDNEFHGTYLKNPRSIHSFSLKGIDKQIFDNQKLKGKWTFVFFGFTNCGYLCPTTMAELAHMVRILEKKKVTLPEVIMISLDPERDSLDKLKTFVHAFHPNFYAARGEESKILAMTNEMGIVYEKINNKAKPNSKNYNVEHSGTVMLFNPKGQLNAFFTLPHHANLMAEDYTLLSSAEDKKSIISRLFHSIRSD